MRGTYCCRWAVACVVLFSGVASLAQDACERLAAAKIPNTTISVAQTVAAGTFNGPPAPFSGVDLSSLYKSLPAFCRVVAEAKPTSDSDIKLEVWLPASGWNGKLQGIGNGGFAGLIDDDAARNGGESRICVSCDRRGTYGIAGRCRMGNRASGEGG